MRPAGSAIDFARSTCGWLLPEQQSYGSFSVDAVLTAHMSRGDETFALSAQVSAGHVYGGYALFRDPPYGYSIALGSSEFRIFRDAWGGPPAEDTVGFVANRFKATAVSIPVNDVRAVTLEDLFAMAEAGVPPLSAKVRLPAQPGLEALTLEFPLRHINVDPQGHRFQVETGPVLVVVPGQGAVAPRLRRAWAMFGCLDRIELMFDQNRPADGQPWKGRSVQNCSITLML